MNKRFWGPENLATLSVYIFIVAVMVEMIINQLSFAEATNWLVVIIAGFAVTVLTTLYLITLKKDKWDEMDEYYSGPKKIDKFLLVVLLLSMCIEGILFTLYAVMFIMTWNQEPPYPHKWNEITMFWVIFVSLVMGITALIKSMLIPKYIHGKYQKMRANKQD